MLEVAQVGGWRNASHLEGLANTFLKAVLECRDLEGARAGTRLLPMPPEAPLSLFTMNWKMPTEFGKGTRLQEGSELWSRVATQ